MSSPECFCAPPHCRIVFSCLSVWIIWLVLFRLPCCRAFCLLVTLKLCRPYFVKYFLWTTPCRVSFLSFISIIWYYFPLNLLACHFLLFVRLHAVLCDSVLSVLSDLYSIWCPLGFFVVVFFFFIFHFVCITLFMFCLDTFSCLKDLSVCVILADCFVCARRRVYEKAFIMSQDASAKIRSRQKLAMWSEKH